MDESLDLRVRLFVFEGAAETGTVPVLEEIAAGVGESAGSVAASLQRLAAGKVIALAPATTNIWMAHPFSAVPPDFRVEARGRTYFGNCIWDGLGVLALLGADGTLQTHCPDCAEPLRLTVRDRRLVDEAEVIHFAVPAARWWDNIGFT